MEKKLIINPAWCKGCNICVSFCPRGVLALSRGKVTIAEPDNCIKCGICESMCPDFAIYIEAEGGKDNG